MSDIIIDPEFKAALPPLSKEELENLTNSILANGCRDALITWNGILIDGHNRYEICKEYGVKFDIIDMWFESRNDVLIWIYQNQIARRNLTDFARTEAALKLKGAIAAKAKENLKTASPGLFGGAPLSNLTEAVNTRTEIASLAGVSAGNVSKVEYLITNATDEIKEELRSGDKSIHKAFVETKEAIEETNTSIFTIGYEGIDVDIFIQTLKEANIKTVIDVRKSGKSQFKPEFSEDILRRELKHNEIEYITKRGYGVVYEMQEPYKAGIIPTDCFKAYYRWYVVEKTPGINELADVIKRSGKSALMCFERGERLLCHRAILAEMIKESGRFDTVVAL